MKPPKANGEQEKFYLPWNPVTERVSLEHLGIFLAKVAHDQNVETWRSRQQRAEWTDGNVEGHCQHWKPTSVVHAPNELLVLAVGAMEMHLIVLHLAKALLRAANGDQLNQCLPPVPM